MAINSVSTSQPSVIKNSTTISSDDTKNTKTSDTKDISQANEAAVYEKSDTQAATPKTYTRDTATINEINKQVEMRFSSLRDIVEKLFSTQNVKNGEAQGLDYDQIMKNYDGKLGELFKNLKVDDNTRLAAEKDISADGFWGVKQASERSISFAKAISGGDPSKIPELRKAIEDGYKAAERAWGGELPEICKQTQEATLKGLDDWAKEAGQTTLASTTDQVDETA